jgi:hypothetical protein
MFNCGWKMGNILSFTMERNVNTKELCFIGNGRWYIGYGNNEILLYEPVT